MVRRVVAALCLGFGTVGMVTPAAGAEGDGIAVIELAGVIDQVNAAYVEEALRTAGDASYAAALIEIDSPGGELTSMDRIVRAILASEVPVIAWVGPEGARAGSAATFVVLAADVAAMAPSTTIGAASVVGAGGEELPETLAAKVTNDAVARIRSLAERHGRNADWAEDAVRDAASVNAEEAVELRPAVVDLVAADLPALLQQIDRGVSVDGRALAADGGDLPALTGLELVALDMNVGQRLLHVLADPNVAFLLFALGFLGLLGELVHPNFVTGIAGAIALVLAFVGSNALPLNVAGLLLVLLGIGLFALETFVTSYGVLTVAGVVALALGASALWTGVEPGVDSIAVSVSPWLIALVAGVGVLYAWVLVRAVLQMRRHGGGPAVTATPAAGAPATAQTAIGPTGIAYADGESWSARTHGSPIGAGAALRVVGVDGLELIVEPARDAANPSTEG
jgi:membrane-bound serine protease (ClpP class)